MQQLLALNGQPPRGAGSLAPGGLRAALLVGVIAAAVGAFDSGSGATAGPAVTYADPAWSPDGKRIAAIAQTSSPQSEPIGVLQTMNAVGIDVRMVTGATPGAAWPTWAPDGKRIAFAANFGRIYVVEASGGKPRQLAAGFHPDWSPGGRKIAYNSGTLDDDTGDVMVVDPKGTRPLAVASYSDPATFTTPTWSPDGERLAFGTADAPDTDATDQVPRIVYISSYGGKVRRLIGPAATDPDWAPGGRKLLYSPSPHGGIAVFDFRTRRATYLHDGEHARWSPNGRRIAFSENGKIYTMQADGTDVLLLTK